MPSASARFSWSRSGEERYSYSESGLILDKDSYSSGISVSQTIFSGGRNYFDIKSSILSYHSSQLNFKNQRASVISSIKEAFYSVIMARQLTENARQSLERTKDQWALIAIRDTLGMADPTEVSQMKVSLAQTELELIQAENNYQQAKENLLALLGMQVSSDISLEVHKDEPYKANSLSVYIDQAMENNLDISTMEISKKQAELSEKSSWGDYLPGISASYSYNWNGSDLPDDFVQYDKEANWSVGISANWSLFLGTSRISSILSKRSSLVEIDKRLEQTKQSIELAVRNAYRNMQEARSRIDLADARVEQAALNSTLFREKFELGDCTLLELLQAELSLREAEVEKISANFDYNIAIAELSRLTGDNGNYSLEN